MTRRAMRTTSIWDTLNQARGARLTRDEYRTELRGVRTAPSSAGIAWRVDTLSTRLPHDPAWEAWQAGRLQVAFDRLDDDLPTLRAELRARRLAGVDLRRIVIAPVIMGGYNAFALEAVRHLARLGENVRVISDEGTRIPEVAVYGDTTWRLCTTPDQIADGAVHLEGPAVTEHARVGLGSLWSHGQDLLDLDPPLEHR